MKHHHLLATATDPNFPLENIPAANVGAFYSLSKGRRNYNGPIFRVRRSSDNAEQDIYANPDGTLDTVSLLSFCGAGSGYGVTLYDQSGNGNHLTQATSANQPRIVTSGVVETKDGFPALRFRYSGSTAVSKLLNTSMSNLAIQSTVFVVASLETTQAVDQTICEIYSSTERNIINHRPLANNNAVRLALTQNPAVSVVNTADIQYSLSSLACHRMRIAPGFTPRANNVINDTALNISPDITRNSTLTAFMLGDDLTAGNDFYGYISEILIGKNMTLTSADWAQACLMRRYVKGGLYSDGVDGANKYAYLADRAEYRITGDISLVAKIATADLIKIDARSFSASVFNKYSNTNRGYVFGISKDREMYITIGTSATTSSDIFTAGNPLPVDLTKPFIYVKWLFDQDAGSSQSKVHFYYSYNGVTFTFLYTYTMAIFTPYASTEQISILGLTGYNIYNAPVTLGNVKLYNGLIDGTTDSELSAIKVLDIDFDSYTYGTTTGITNSVLGDAVTLSNVQII